MVEPCEIGRSYHSQLGQHSISTPLRTTVSASFVSFEFFATFSVQFTFQRDYPIIHAFTPCWSLWCRQGAPLLLLKPSGFAPLCGHPHQRSELLRHQRWSSLEGRMWLSALPSKRTFRVIAYHAYWKFTNFEEGNTWTAMIDDSQFDASSVPLLYLNHQIPECKGQLRHLHTLSTFDNRWAVSQVC